MYPATIIAIALWVLAGVSFIVGQIQQPFLPRAILDSDHPLWVPVHSLASSFASAGYLAAFGAIFYLVGEIQAALGTRTP
jgi:hypothetical protein